jgi:hypothetical protein
VVGDAGRGGCCSSSSAWQMPQALLRQRPQTELLSRKVGSQAVQLL